MTKAEKELKDKRRLAMAFLQEQQQLSKRHMSTLSTRQAKLDKIVASADKQASNFITLAQNGITWQELRDTYEMAFKAGENAMVEYRMSFLFGSVVIALNEIGFSQPAILGFLHQMIDLVGNHTRDELVQECIATTSIDTAPYDPEVRQVIRSKKDAAAIKRMRSSGITKADLEYEKSIGYEHGWNQRFFLSMWYAAACISLLSVSSVHAGSEADADTISDGSDGRAVGGMNAASSRGDDNTCTRGYTTDINAEAFLNRVIQITDEEITTDDILERAKVETGIYLADMIREEVKIEYV